MGRIEVEQELGTETQEPDDSLIDAVGIGLCHPVVQVSVHLKVGEPIGQRHRHGNRS